jgi:hypothetical protein
VADGRVPVRSHSLVNVSGRLQDFSKGHDRGIQLQHVLLNDKVFPPDFQDVGLESRSGRPIVEETGASTVDFERRSKEEPPREQGIEQGLVEFVSRLIDDHWGRVGEGRRVVAGRRGVVGRHFGWNAVEDCADVLFGVAMLVSADRSESRL